MVLPQVANIGDYALIGDTRTAVLVPSSGQVVQSASRSGG